MQAASPIGLLYIARYLNENGINAKVYNADYEGEFMPKEADLSKRHEKYLRNLYDPDAKLWKIIRQVIKKYSPKIIGISSVTSSYISALNIVKIIKKELPDTKVILGGPHVTALPEKAASEPGVDAVVIGEGEQTMLEIAKGIDYKNIKGLCYQDGKKIVKTGCRELIKDIDALPFPKIEDMVFEKNIARSFSEIFSGRGCPYNCIFCASALTWKRNLRLRKSENVYQEMLFRKDNYGTTEFVFEDDALTLNKKRLIAICKYIKKLNVTWACQTRADHVSRDIIRIMKDSGCNEIALGIESGNQKVLDIAKKNLKVEDIKKAAKIIKKEGLHLVTFFIFGLPGETEESIEDTFSLIREIKPTTMVSNIATPLPGTEFFNMAEDNKWLANQNWANYYFHGRTDSVVDIPTIEKKKILEAYWKFQKMADKLNVKDIRKKFLNPLFIYKNLKINDLTKPYELLRKIKIFYNVIKG